MREIAAGVQLIGPGREVSWASSTIHSNCQKRLLDLELNLDDGVTTFNTIQWALAELERIEEQSAGTSLQCAPGDDLDEDQADGTSRSKVLGLNVEIEQMDDLVTTENQENERVAVIPGIMSGALRSSISEAETVGAPCVVRKVGRQNPDELLILGEKYPQSSGSKDELTKGDLENRRNQLNLPGGSKRKSAEGESRSDGDKRTKVRESSTALRAAVISAVEGEAGYQMSDRISSRLKLPECVSLTGLISQCLLVSLDQTPADTVREALARTSRSPWRVGLSGEETGSSRESMWLHSWFVRRTLTAAVNSTLYATLDWLVAYLSASHTTIIKPVLDDLVADLSKCEVDGHQYMALYIQRTGILEYAALREPERAAGTLLAMFCSGMEQNSVDNAGGSLQDQSKGPWPGFHPNICLGLSVLCPKFFSAFTTLWVPTLSVDVVKSWSMIPSSDADFIFLPACWKFLEVSASEEPKSWRAWFCAAMVKRLPELAPVASHIVLLVSALCDISADSETSQGPSEVGYYLLGSLYKVLSKHVLPSVLGADRDNMGNNHSGTCGERKLSRISMFLENLQEHAHLVWREVLDVYARSQCPCCNVAFTEGGQDPDFRENNCSSVDGKDRGTLNPISQYKLEGVEFQRGCLNRDPLIQVCQLLFLCCAEEVVANLLANATWVTPCSTGIAKSELKKMLVVKKMLQIVVGQGRGSLMLDLWAQRVTDSFLVASDEQALCKVLAVRQLLDLKFWQVHRAQVENLQAFRRGILEKQDAGEDQWRNLVWKLLRSELDAKWLPILTLMHRDGAWELRLAVLGLLQQLPPIDGSRSQIVANRLKGVLGLYFSWLETLKESGDLFFDGHEYGTAKSEVATQSKGKWQYAREMEHLKRIIIRLASCSYPSFTMLLSRLLDFSFDHCPQMPTMPSPTSPINNSVKTELGAAPLRRMSSAPRSSLSVAPLSVGKLDRYGKLTLISECASAAVSSTATGSSPMQLYEENSRIQSDGFSSLHSGERERFRKTFNGKQSNGGFSKQSCAGNSRKRPDISEVVGPELGNLLRRTFQRALSQSAEASDPWPYHPVGIMNSLMTERLETPHEVLMTMEQYEEVLPKHISSLRHIFLAECFSQNALLMEMLELVVKHGKNGEVLRCMEFVRVLLADCISRWHSNFRTRRSHSAPVPKVHENEARSRLQVHRLIQLVASAGWLPPPLASSGEIVAVIDGADVADLLLLVWRCMHHAVAFGTKSWGGSSSNLPGGRGSVDAQGFPGGNEESGKEGTYTEWESHYFSILRQNVAQISPHFAQVYPLHKAM